MIARLRPLAAAGLVAILVAACGAQTASPSGSWTGGGSIPPSVAPPPTTAPTEAPAPDPATAVFTLLDFNIEYGGDEVDFASKIARPVDRAKDRIATQMRTQEKPKMMALKTPRVGLYQSYVASMDEGWTRFVFDKGLTLDYTSLHDRDIRGGSLGAK